MKLTQRLVLAAVTISAAQGAGAQSFRCKTDLASIGDSKASVVQKCGTPVSKDSFCKSVPQPTNANPAPGATSINIASCTNVDEWTYNPATGSS